MVRAHDLRACAWRSNADTGEARAASNMHRPRCGAWRLRARHSPLRRDALRLPWRRI